MKNLIKILVLISVIAIGCEGPEGPPGPEGATGPTGPIGPIGQNGSDGQNGQNGQDGEDADVTQYNYPGFTHTGVFVQFAIPKSYEEISESVVLGYAEYSGFWYPIPGYVLSTYEYRIFIDEGDTSSETAFNMVRVEGTGDQTFTALRILVIPAITVTNGRNAGIDFSDYEAVAEYYNLNN
ncbi:hypothetical protein [Ekhidna sp.]